VADFGVFPLEEKVSQLWQSLPGDPENDYPDEALQRQYGVITADLGFLLALTWGPQQPKRQKEIWVKAREKFEGFKTEYHKLDTKQLDALAGCYPFGRGRNGWQGRHLRNAHRFLRVNGLSMADLAARLKAEEPPVARAVLQDLLESSNAKVIDSYLRDILWLDAFPIDARITRVLGKYSIPPDPSAIVAICRKLRIPVRPFARAVGSMGAPPPRKPSR
jgi:hypothetical protein